MSHTPINIFGFSASPRLQGSTAWAVNTLLKGAQLQGAHIFFKSAARLDLRPCQACFACRSNGRHCVINDDMPSLDAAILQAQCLVLGLPIFMGQMSAQAKIFLDRLHPLFAPRFSPTFEPQNAGKKLLLAFVQGNPDPALFRTYIDYTEQLFRTLEFDVQQSLIITGTRSHNAKEQQDLQTHLQTIGASLCS